MGLDWFSVGTEASGGGTPDLLCSPMFLGYMEIYIGGRSTSGGPGGAHKGGGRAQGGGRAPCLVTSSQIPRCALQVFWASFLPKNEYREVSGQLDSV